MGWKKSHSSKQYSFATFEYVPFLTCNCTADVGLDPASNRGHIRHLFGTIVSDKPLHHLQKKPEVKGEMRTRTSSTFANFVLATT